MSLECKHDMGWLPDNRTRIFVFEDGTVRFGFATKRNKRGKILMRCNYPDCNAVRNVYLDCKVRKYGKVRQSLKPDNGGEE